MAFDIKLFISGVRREDGNLGFHSINESEKIQIKILNISPDVCCRIFIEDYEVQCGLIYENEEWCITTENKNIFGECFGFSSVRVYLDDSLEKTFVFSVAAKKMTAEQARLMIEYLSSKSSGIIKAFLSRTAMPHGYDSSSSPEPEMLLSCIESLAGAIQDNRRELTLNLKKRLVPVRLPLSAASVGSWELDPSDVIQNLDSLSPSVGEGEVYIRGRAYDVNNIDVLSLNPTNDIFENRVLLGALYAARRMLLELDALLAWLPRDESGVPDGYEDFSRFLLSLTAGELFRRSLLCQDKIKSLIVLFERNFQVNFLGEIAPVITPYVRGVRIYRTIFSIIFELYSLGKPTVGKLRFMMKLKSLSRIYEIFVYYNILEHFNSLGWNIISAERHQDEDLGQFVPKSVVFENQGDNIKIEYEPFILKHNDRTSNFDLVDVYHYESDKNPYYNPDFVVRLNSQGVVRYLILDAKYSTTKVVREMHVPNLYQKYFERIAVYDAEQGVTTSSPIVSVVAIYPLAHPPYRFVSIRGYPSIYSNLPRIPIVGGIPLTTERDVFFGESLNLIFVLAKRTIYSRGLNG